MTKGLKAMAIVTFSLAITTGTASAYSKEDTKKVVSSNEKSVVIVLDGVPSMVTTKDDTVGDILKSLTHTGNVEYSIEGASLETKLAENMVINLSSISEKTKTETEKISFDTIVVENDELMEGTQRVAQEGKEGAFEVTYKEKYSRDKLISSSEIKREIISNPVDEIIEKGTKKEEPKVEEVKTAYASGNVIDGHTYKDAINLRATGYTRFDAGCDDYTATGMLARRGVAAVDTSVIPFGTKLYIPGYGVAVAADTGGAINGHRIDLCYDSVAEAYEWGVKNITAYVIE